jgi:hypothetical protein
VNPKEIFLKNLEEIKQRFLTRMSGLLSGNVDRVELARLVAELDLFRELQAEGFTDALDIFLDDYDEQLRDLIELAEVQKIRDVFTTNRNLFEFFKQKDAEKLLGSAKFYADDFQKQMVLGIAEGKPFNEVTKGLSNLPLTTAQVNAAVTTGYNDYGRSLTALTYQDEPEQKFLYVGTIIPTSSKQCTWLLINQNMEGYTKEEIDNGISTPFGIINWQGRVPNFNCDDRFLPATKEITKRAKRFAEDNRDLSELILKGKK